MDIKSISRKWHELDERKAQPSMALKLSKKDKRFLTAALAIAFVITLAYWVAGGRNLFTFPAVLCIVLVARKFLPGSSGRGYFTRGTRALAVRRNGRIPNKRR